MPSDTYDDVGLYDAAGGGATAEGADMVGCKSGVLEMIFCALLVALVTTVVWDGGVGVMRGAEAANASSANFSVTLWLRSFDLVDVGGELSNSNLEPCSCNSEN